MSTTKPDALPCWIYRSSRKNEMYLYLQEEDNFDPVPEALIQLFGTPTLVMELRLHPQRALAREDIGQVMQNLRSQGFHLQMPPTIEPEMRHS